MRITIRTNAGEVDARFDAVATKQLPFATALAITKTARSAQRAVQARMPQIFRLRGTERLFRNAVKSKPASKRDLVADVRIEGPETVRGYDERIRRIIMRHEAGGVRTSHAQYLVHGRMVSLGFFLPARGATGGGMARRLYPANLGVVGRRDVNGATYFAAARKGRKVRRGGVEREFSYFATTTGIYERRKFGPSSAIRLLWAFERQIRLAPRLRFYPTVRDVFARDHVHNFREAMAFALRTAK